MQTSLDVGAQHAAPLRLFMLRPYRYDCDLRDPTDDAPVPEEAEETWAAACRCSRCHRLSPIFRFAPPSARCICPNRLPPCPALVSLGHWALAASIACFAPADVSAGWHANAMVARNSR